MQNQILQKMKKVSRKTKRIMALGLAVIVTVGGMNLSLLEVNAGASNVVTPTYTENNGVGSYDYNSGDIFGAATHVHLFGHNVTTTAVHTHGNIMCENATLSEIGMRDGKITYPTEYIEYSYVGTSLTGADSVINGHLILGPSASGAVSNLVPGYISADRVHTPTNSGVVDIDGTLNTLAAQSTQYYNTITSPGVNVSLNAETHLATVGDHNTNPSIPEFDPNGRYIDTNQINLDNSSTHINIYVTLDQFNGTEINFTGLDADVTHSGIVIVNIDMAGYDDATVNVSGAGIIVENEDSSGNTYTYNNEEHSSAAFGSCRVIYNIVDSSQDDKLYKGKLTWMGTIFGSILAPRATVNVGAVNGTVMAHTIVHSGMESHRMDIYPLFSDTSTEGSQHKEYNEIRLLLDVKDVNSNNVTGNTGAGTMYQLYSAASCATDKAVSGISATAATWNETLGQYEMIIDAATVTNAVRNGNITPGQTYYLKKTAITAGYDLNYGDNNAVYEVVVNTNGTVSYRKSGSSESLTQSVRTDVITIGTTPSDATTSVDPVSLYLVLKDESGNAVPGTGTNASGTTYTVYDSSNNPVTGLENLPAIWNSSTGTYIVTFFGKTTSDLPAGDYYFEKVTTTDGYTTNDDTFTFRVASNGTVTYKQSNNSYTTAVLTDVLTKTPTAPTYANVDDVTLKLVLEDERGTAVPGTGTNPSGTTYDVKKSSDNTTVIEDINATWDTTLNTYVVKITGQTTQTFPEGDYYFVKDTVTSGYNGNDDTFTFHVDADGNVTYKQSDNSYSETILQDVINKTIVNVADVRLTLTLQNETGAPEAVKAKDEQSETFYDVIDSDGNVVLNDIPAISNGTTYEVLVTGKTTEVLPAGDYYFKKDQITSGYNGNNETFGFTVGSDGTITYPGGVEPSDVIQRPAVGTPTVGEVKLTVTLEGATNPTTNGTSSGVKYDVKNSGGTTVITGMTATWNGSAYEVMIPAGSTALTPGDSYYFERSDKPQNWDTATGYGTIYNFTVESDGSITYKDGSGNTITSLQDRLVTTNTSGTTPPGTGNTNNGGTTDSGNNNNNNNSNNNSNNNNNNNSNNNSNNNNNNDTTGSTNNNTGTTNNTTPTTTTPTTGTTTSGGTDVAVATPTGDSLVIDGDGSAAGGSDVTATGGDGSVTGGSDLTATGGDTDMLTSANTGEFKTGGIFAGYVAVLAIAAAVYVVTKKKRA